MRFIFLILFFLLPAGLQAQAIRGKVSDAKTGDDIIGAVIVLGEQRTKGVVSGLDGSFSMTGVTAFPVTLVVSFIGYTSQEIVVENASPIIVRLEQGRVSLDAVVVISDNSGRTDNSARAIERASMNVINVVSAHAIEISPDMTVANVIQRMSGVTLERNSSGDEQYALLRGMDKRFNYTLVNGVKIPSPDNKNRFVPLDIFPAELLDRLEITKAITADMEGDGIGGAVNMVMKDAPSQLQVNANISTGFNTQFFSRNYQQFDYSAIDRQSLFAKYGLGFPVSTSNFTTRNLRVTERNMPPMNLAGGFSAGGRVFNDYLGILVAASYSNIYRGTASDRYAKTYDADREQNITHRDYSTEQRRAGAHAKFDLRLNRNHKLMWYNAYMDFRNIQVRDAIAKDKHDYRLRWNRQSILSSTLKGIHNIWNDKLRFDWSFAYGDAFNETPDNVTVRLRIGRDGRTYADPTGSVIERRWEENSDNDKAAYANLTYFTQAGAVRMEWSAGGMYRDKQRESRFHDYRFRTNPPVPLQYRGVDWEYFDEIGAAFDAGSYNDALNYDASEKIGAGYAQVKASFEKIQLLGGFRMEHTRQGYDLLFPQNNVKNTGFQDYYDWLPNFHAKYELNRNTNLRFSYVKAINRPSFFEIVPYSKEFDDYYERGNPDIRRTIADNIDLRYEYFPRQSEQLMVGVFYKHIKDPIEYTFVDIGQQAYYMPRNYGNAYNAGIEIDITKYFRWFGVKTNYTFTNSRITTDKWLLADDIDPNSPAESKTVIVSQTRPLFGQAAHVANLSLLYKGMQNGWDAQLAFSYTGKRLVYISEYVDEDWWQAGYIRLDASVEKHFAKTGLTLFAKANNLLDTPMYQYIHPNPAQDRFIDFARKNGGLLERKELYGRNIMVGLKFKL
ncbi:MAG: TonB-dependent receptor [Rikenellaceae bacterium]|nr:TonB-dependent receptor [Rikenellaceae bacterium]